MKTLDKTFTLLDLMLSMRKKKADQLHKAYDSDVSWEYYEGWHDAIEELQKQIKDMEGDQND
jgi:hypothetical protein|tara:strand:+ start:226 stop:411 length:186 start_codon:yes stop_codon:yes gene_type:complete